jgi:serine/threonine protein phosphatase PrpC
VEGGSPRRSGKMCRPGLPASVCSFNEDGIPCEDAGARGTSRAIQGQALSAATPIDLRNQPMQNESISRVECCAATRPQQGRSQNEDAFLIGRSERPFAALCDGAGNAERAAKRVLALFEKLLNEATPEQITAANTWTKWIKLLDSSLLGAAQSTFLALAFTANEAAGVCVGDSRLYILNREGQCRILTEGASKQRLGSGAARPFLIRLTLVAGDILLLLSDGAWTPLNPYLLQKTVVHASVRHFTEVPAAILDAAGKASRADDMTALALRLARTL